MSRTFKISEMLSVFIQETVPTLLSTCEREGVYFSEEIIEYHLTESHR